MAYDKQTVIKKGLSALEKLQFVALILFSLVLIAGVDLITADIGWDLITDPYFYTSNVITDIALLMVTFGTVYLVLDVMKATNETYTSTKRQIDEFASGKKNVPSILSRFLEQINRKRKRNQYEYNILTKLYNLENKKKWYAYLPIVHLFVRNKFYYTEEEMHIWNFGTEEEKAKSKYCRKRKMYEEQLTPELIEKVIDVQYVKYDKITVSILLNDFYMKGRENQVNDFVTKDENTQIARFRIPTLILSFGFTFLITSLVLDSINFNWIAIITISSKLLSIAWNVFTSYRYAKKHFKNVTLHDVLFRWSIIVEYYKWLGEVADSQPDVKKITLEEIKQTISTGDPKNFGLSTVTLNTGNRNNGVVGHTVKPPQSNVDANGFYSQVPLDER